MINYFPRRFPRADTSADAAYISPDVYNALVGEIEQIGKLLRLALSKSSETPLMTFTAWLTAATQDGSNMRWYYDWQQIYLNATGYSAGAGPSSANWSAVTNGLSGTNSDNTPAMSYREDSNWQSSPYGNGVSQSNLTGSCALQQSPLYVPVKMDIWQVGSTDGVGYWFYDCNGIDT